MIRSIRHHGLKLLYEEDDLLGVSSYHVETLRDILPRLDVAATIEDMELPGFRIHSLSAESTGFWAVNVRANGRLMFRFENGDVWDLDYIEYR